MNRHANFAVSVLVAVTVLSGCGTTTDRPAATWPVSAEQLPPAISSPMPSGFGPATWALDAAFAQPGPDATVLHVLVWEGACSGGSPATGRMSPPVVVATASTVTISIGVRDLTGMQTCPEPPGTPAVLTLPGPLGSRTLLDGGLTPPGPPTPRL